MKLSLSLFLLLGATALFQGCSSSKNEDAAVDNNTKKSTIIKGSATLGSILNNDATVCLDVNNNKTCDEDEPSTQTNEVGQYKLIVDDTVDEGTLLIAQDGVNLLPPPPEKEEQTHLKFYKQYQNSEREQNINVFTTLVTNEIENNPSMTYKDAIKTVINDKFGDSENCAFITSGIVVGDPIEKEGDFLRCMNGLQYITYNDDASPIKKSSPLRVAAEDNNSSSLDDYINESSDYFDQFLTSLTEYVDEFSTWFDSLFTDDTAENNVTTPDDNNTVPVDTERKEVEIVRDSLNGIWYIIDASGDKTCSDIRSNDKMSVTEADGKTTDLTLTFDNSKKTMLLKVGFFTADTINFTAYYDDETFTANYKSDGETMSGSKMDSLATCKSEKLGL